MASWLSALAGGIGGTVGGAAQGASAAYPQIMQSAQRRGEQEDLQGYRSAQLEQGQERVDIAREESGWRQAYQEGILRDRERQSEIDRIRAETDRIRANQASRTEAGRTDQERYSARLRRAERTLSLITPDMTPAERNRIARDNGWADIGQAIGVQQTYGEAMPMPGEVPPGGAYNPASFERYPQESGLNRIQRLTDTYDMSPSELGAAANAPMTPQVDPGFSSPEEDRDAMLREQVRRVRGLR